MNIQNSHTISFKKYSFEYLEEWNVFFNALKSFFIILNLIKRELENNITICMNDFKEIIPCFKIALADVWKNDASLRRDKFSMCKEGASLGRDKFSMCKEDASLGRDEPSIWWDGSYM